MFRTEWKRRWVIGVSGFLAIILASSVPSPTDAGLVYGRVSGASQRRVTLKVQMSGGRKVQVTTDENGNYRVFLPPGIYTVESGGKTAVIRSHPEPMQQDINLR